MRGYVYLVVGLLSLLAIPSRAIAEPKLYYCAATGDLVVENDALNVFMNIRSTAGRLNAPAFPNGPAPEGSFVDSADLPYFMALLNYPVGTFRLGPGTVDAETPISDLSMEWYWLISPQIQQGEVIARCVPEPATLATSGLAAAGLLVTVRRRRGNLSTRVAQLSLMRNLSMRPFALIIAALLVSVGIADQAMAAPTLYYCPRTGDLWVENDIQGVILNIKSPAGSLNAPLLPEGSLPEPAFIDLTDLPNFLPLFSVPTGKFHLGPGVVDPGTPISEVGMDFITAFGPAVSTAQVIARCIPEPATLATAALAAVGFLATVRRRRSGFTDRRRLSLVRSRTMRPFALVIAALLVSVGVVSQAMAAPKLYYCSITGDLWVENDIQSLVLNIKSPAGSLNVPSLPDGLLPEPAYIDFGDLPNFLAIWNVPTGRFHLGPGTVDPGTPISNVAMDIYTPFGQPVFTAQVIAFCIPEPSSLSIGATSIVGWAVVRRRMPRAKG